MKKYDLIATADLHFIDWTPACRTDDIWKTQERKWEEIMSLASKNNCPIMIAGDIFTKWKASPKLVNFLMYLSENTYGIHAIPGNHDLPYHSLDHIESSSFETLIEAGLFKPLYVNRDSNNPINYCVKTRKAPKRPGLKIIGVPFGLDIPEKDFRTDLSDRQVLVTHTFVYEKEEPFPNAPGGRGVALLKKYPMYDLIITGDNHEPFVVKYKGRVLVNPGSIFRWSAAQINHKPRVYLYDAKENKVKPHFLQIDTDVISTDHIERKNEIEERIKEFSSKMLDVDIIGLDFAQNLQSHFEKYDVPKEVQKIIWEALEDGR